MGRCCGPWRQLARPAGSQRLLAAGSPRCAAVPAAGPEARLAATRMWLEDVVVAGGLCPFARRVADGPRLRLRASEAADAEALVAELAAEAAVLVGAQRAGELLETTLLVLDGQRPFVAEWLDFVRLSWRLQAEAILGQGFAGDLQLVLFHPRAVRSAYAQGPADPADYALRAPHPTLHLLREADVLEAVRSFPGADQIPRHNQARLRKQGLEACAARLAACGVPKAG
mmetsp:Transcript_63398/g.204341  ORF Transcript_63398/g.204341 Transcript_63398/m.204341 type:complete len:228 (-) Transcript_63398:15-698(-)